MAEIIQNILNALQWGSFYALIALGYTLVYGVLTLINFAHGDVFMVGAYIAFSEDPDVHYKYIVAAAKTGNVKEVGYCII